MQPRLALLLVIAWSSLQHASHAAESALFVDAEPVAVTIVAPMRELISHRSDKASYPARLQFTGADGRVTDLPVALSARGHSRLRACSFPPLRLAFEPDVARDTLFAGLRRVKLVTQCTTRNTAESWLALEYGIYRGYNVLTDASYRVRRLDVTFREADSSWSRFQQAFIIEPDEHVAARLGRVAVRPPRVDYEQFDKQEMAISSLYQYLIANTDYAVKRGPEGEGCCHNGRVFAPRGSDTDFVYLPYDFDQAGLVNTDYARPDRRLEIPNVRTRLYRGFCWHNDELAPAIARFNERREELLAAMLPDTLSKGMIRRSTNFIDRFYSTVNDPESRQRNLLDSCRGPESLEIRHTTEAAN
jgi:hypothetical protein